MRCCETVEKESGRAGQNATETEVRQPIHYTGGAKEMELEMSIGSLRETVRINQEMQNKVCDELREEITVVQSKLIESNKTLSLILAKLICPTKFQADGFRAPEMPPSSHTTHPTTATHQITDQIHQATVTLPSTTATHVTTQQAMNHTQQAAVTLPTTAIHVTTQQAMNQAHQATVTLPTMATHVTTQQAMNQALQTTVTLPTTATHVTTTNQATVTHLTTATHQATHETTATNQATDQASATGQADESISFNDSLLSPSPVYMEHDIPVNYEIVEAVEETPGILNSKIIANIKKNSCSRKKLRR
ncbi:uncharacterized protein [Dysidea avara]|uniref:uncharacterized protein n=1 Tax=Dysidea avara TaxID=196820 RepID=UPI00332DD8DC